jgi:hypothetical protein
VALVYILMLCLAVVGSYTLYHTNDGLVGGVDKREDGVRMRLDSSGSHSLNHYGFSFKIYVLEPDKPEHIVYMGVVVLCCGFYIQRGRYVKLQRELM